jgi:hypothetical protein
MALHSYYEERALEGAFAYLKRCKQKSQVLEDFVSSPKYFDCNQCLLPGEVPGITIKSFYDFAYSAEPEKNICYLFVTPYWECCTYRLLHEDFKAFLTTSLLVDKLKTLLADDELMATEKFCLKIDNRQQLGTDSRSCLFEGFYESIEDECFYFKNY